MTIEQVAVSAPGASVITWWAVVSAFGGAIIGGGISYFLARMNLKAAKKQREDDRRETRKALGYSLLFKIIKIVSGFESLGRSVRGCLDEAGKRGVGWRPWQVVLPIANLPSDVVFSADEMALVLSLNDNIFNQIAALDELHNSTSTLFSVYAAKRSAMTERFGAEKMEGMTGTASLTKEQYEWTVPRAAELDGLIEVMLQRTEQDGQKAKQALKDLHPVLDKSLGIKHRLEFKN